MTPQTEQPINIAEETSHPAAVAETSQAEPRPVPVIYEDVTLTEEAAEILERLAREKAEAKQSARKPRPIPLGDPKSLPS